MRRWIFLLPVLVTWSCAPSPGQGAAGDRARLVAAVGERRVLRGRASGGFRFGPESGRKRGGPDRLQASFEVLRVSAEIRRNFDADPSAANSGNLAIAYLLIGDIEKGVRLAEARSLEEESAEALADLSAAYLERAGDERDADDFARAYEAALRALRVRPDMPEALFDRALAAEGLGLSWAARPAFEEYLRREPNGPWSGVARQGRDRVARLEARNDLEARERPRIFAALAAGRLADVRAIAGRRPDLAREAVRRVLLPAVALAIMERRSIAESLALAREMDGLARAGDTDSLDQEALALLVRGDHELAAAHVEFAKASQMLDERKVEEGAPGVLHATAIFRAKGSPYAAQGELQSALADFFRGRRDGLVGRYSKLIDLHRSRYPLLLARALWMRALCESFVSADGWRALVDRLEAHRLLTAAAQVDAARQIASQLADSLREVGREEEAGSLLTEVLSSQSLQEASLRTQVTLEMLSDHLRRLSLPLAALEVRTLAGPSALRAGPVAELQSVIGTLELAAEAGDESLIAGARMSAERSLSAIADPQIRAEMEIAYSLATVGLDGGAGRHRSEAAEALVQRLRERKNANNLRRALTLSGEQLLAEGRFDRAETALREALDLHFLSRRKVSGEFGQIKEFEGAERPADDLVDLLSRAERADDATRAIERVRNPEAVEEPALASLTRGLSADTALVSYWPLKDRLLADVVTKSGIRHLSLPIGRPELKRLVRRLNASIAVGSDVLVGQVLAELHDALIARVIPALGPARKLVIVPDREVWEVPFAGLAAKGAEPMAANYEISFASSLADRARPRPTWTPPRSILAIGSPAWDKAHFADLGPLPESGSEARDTASLYPKARVLVGASATRSAIRGLAPGFDVVHVATHAVGNARDPGKSFLLLSAEGEDPGAWRASDPGWEALAGTRLVVLSACRTGAERSRFGGSALGVLKSIQSKGGAEVLVSVGDVDDRASRSLLANFHRHLVTGATPAAALRLAQREAFDQRSGTTWMLFRIVT